MKKGDGAKPGISVRNLNEPFVSIHLAICNEPLPLLRRTIRAALRQSYSNFELIVVSNNYSDRELVSSIQGFLESLGPRVRFVHEDYIEGYKAGALNLALSMVAKETEYVLTLDSDYILVPDALQIAVDALQERKLDLIQFPQNYHNTSKGTRGLQEDFKHYFNIYSMPGNNEGATLPTGTLTLIDRSVLHRIGGWPTTSITEDAELGTQLIANGFRTGYDARSIGKGLMPSDLHSFYAQRSRWIFGNMQTLLHSFHRLRQPMRIRWTIWLQLTAWINFLALPIIAMILAGVLAGFNVYRFGPDIIALSLINFLIHFATQHYLLAKTSGPSSTSAAFAIHLATLDWSAFIWLQNFSGIDKPFKRTSKDYAAFSYSYRYLLVPVLLILSGITLSFTVSLILGYALACIGALMLWGKSKLVGELRNIPKTI
ncbi:MAG: glycosyltransferase [Pricia sp.]